MRTIWLVAGQELIVNLRRPAFIVMTLLVPMIGVLVLGTGSLFGGQVGSLLRDQFSPKDEVTGYVDLSGLLTSELPQYAGLFIAYPDEASARAAMLSGEIKSYFITPADYLQTGRVIVYGTEGGFSAFVQADEGVLRYFLVDQLLAGRVDSSILGRVQVPAVVETVRLDDAGQVSDQGPFSWLADFVLPYLFSLLFFITIFVTSGYLLQGVAEEKEGRVIEILISSIGPTELLAGKILGLCALGLIQVFVWIGSVAALLVAATSIFALAGGLSLSLGTLVLGVVYYLLGYLLYATLMAAGGSLGTSARESQQIGSLVSIAAVIPMMTMSLIFSNPSAPLVVILSYIPPTAPVMMLMRLGFGPVPAEQVVISLLLLVAGIAVSLWAGAKVFRAGLLMYGKRPSLRDLARAFKQA
jgi:ABC-2 type transport system permease protein